MKDILEKEIRKILDTLGVAEANFTVERPGDLSHGDYATNVALAASKLAKKNPRALAESIVAKLAAAAVPGVANISIAGPGFINVTLAPSYFGEAIAAVLARGERYGQGSARTGEKVLIEYTDPNPFKPLHIGHLMSNAIGESLSRLIAAQGAAVSRACYQGDVGLHVAKAMWGMRKDAAHMPTDAAPLSEKSDWLGKAYVSGSSAYDADEAAKAEIVALNKQIFELTDPALKTLYEKGRAWSLAHFDEVYERLGTKFDYFFFEREMAPIGTALVREWQGKGVFEESEGAVVYRGEADGLHTRVFITKDGLPTYEAKELGLAKRKLEAVPFDRSIVITASEQSDYFKVVLAAMRKVLPAAAEKTTHVAHGMMRFASGKMSSRKGNVITAEALLEEVRAAIAAKVAERDYSKEEQDLIARDVGIAALKYSILRQAPGGDIIYDFEKSISLEGDSGPYLQYAATRAKSVLEKARGAKLAPNPARPAGETLSLPERLLPHFPDIVERAARELAPQHVATYLIELAGAFNAYYAETSILQGGEVAPYRLALAEAVRIVISNGLSLLGIRTPERM